MHLLPLLWVKLKPCNGEKTFIWKCLLIFISWKSQLKLLQWRLVFSLGQDNSLLADVKCIEMVSSQKDLLLDQAAK